MSRVLIVEDDPMILRGLRDNLAKKEYDVITASDGEEGYRLALSGKPDLIILDLMLPNMNGLEICQKLRADGSSVPILMLTARGEESDRVLGLDLGADDYVTKPFSIRELLARVRARLRSAQTGDTLPDELRFDDVVVDFKRFEATRCGSPLEMTKKEFAILRLLAARVGEVVSREDLLNDVWGYENYPSTRTIDTHIGWLRAKLESNPASPKRLITVHGVGYKLTIP
ncbi:MAG TPA: response regulator transcription factor [Vicinamibacterales bacterium]|nr:response regulator transcription factor [Vicinamibacterales bacterium]